MANATRVIANRTSNVDLFWALKGGSNNFGSQNLLQGILARMLTCSDDLGIVTHMTLKTYPIGRVWGGQVLYNETYQDDIMNAFATYQQAGQLDTKSATITYMYLNNGTISVTLV